MISHLSREQLLRHLDGELSGSSMRRAEAHLHACWSCQVEFDRLKQHIALIFDAQAVVFGPSLPPPPKPWPRLEPRLEQATSSGIPFWRRLTLFWARSRGSLAYVTAGMAALLVGILIWAPLRPVSAKEVLSKEISIDTGRQSITSQQVVRQRVKIRKTSTGSAGERVAALESWKSTRSAYWKSKSDPVNTELLDQYKANGLASSLPLSPTAVESWARVAGSEPSASREGQNIFVQVVSNPAGQARGLKEVNFRVKTADWHMDQMTLSFADATFQISEEESSILDKHEIPAEILSALEPTAEDPLRTSMPATSEIKVPEAPGLTGVPVPVNPDDLEMAARYALHDIGADLGEGIEIAVRPPSQVVINAAAASPQRKEQIEAMLGNKPGIRLEFQEPFSDNSSNGAATKATAIPNADQSRQIPDPLLIQYFGSSVAQENYTRSVLQASTDILAHLYALRELAGRWPPGSDERLSADAKAKLTVILRDHAKQLRMGTSTLKTDLQLILKGEQTTPQPIAMGGIRWQDASSSGLDAASRLDDTLRALLTISDAHLSVDQALPKLQQGSADLELAVDELVKPLQ